MTLAQDDRDGMTRDFRGYGGDLPEARWPGGARVCVSLVVNVEEGAELNLRAGDEANEPVHEIVSTVRDVPPAWSRISSTARVPAGGASRT